MGGLPSVDLVKEGTVVLCTVYGGAPPNRPSADTETAFLQY